MTLIPILIELFTSEGCSSCPPADDLLRELARQPVQGVELITLGQHVDYWDRLGWRDPFSARSYSERQQIYARAFDISGPYTPQMIVDGRWQFTGSDTRSLKSALEKAVKLPKAPVRISLADGIARVLVGDLPQGSESAEVWLAIVEDSLETQVLRGENSGRRLRHGSVVRRLDSLGKFAPSFEREAPLTPGKEWTSPNLKVVVFVQERRSKRVLGAAAARVSP